MFPPYAGLSLPFSPSLLLSSSPFLPFLLLLASPLSVFLWPPHPPPTPHSLHSFQPLSAAYTEKKEIGTAVNLRDPSQGQSEFRVPRSCLPPLGGQEQWTAPPRGCLGGQDFLIAPGGEFLACEARGQTSLTFMFVPLLCYQLFISKEKNITVHPSPLHNNSFSKIIAVLLPIISFWRQLRLSASFCAFFSSLRPHLMGHWEGAVKWKHHLK